MDRRKVFTDILHFFKTAIAWDDLPAELGWGCGKTCREALRRWHAAGVWTQLHAAILAELNTADSIDRSRAVIDGTFVKAPLGGGVPARAPRTAANPGASTTSRPRAARPRWP